MVQSIDPYLTHSSQFKYLPMIQIRIQLIRFGSYELGVEDRSSDIEPTNCSAFIAEESPIGDSRYTCGQIIVFTWNQIEK